MRVRTAKQLFDVVQVEQAWRKKELSTLKLTHDAARSHQQQLLRRAGVTLLYAHFEGFVKEVGTSYVEFVARAGMRYRDLADNFVALSAKRRIQQFSQTNRGELICEVARFFMHGMAERAVLQWRTAVQTKSNLSPAVLRDIIAILGLDYAQFQIHEKTVIDRLRILRNSIAHGKRLLVDTDDYHTLHDRVLKLIDEFGRQVSNAALLGRYKATPRPGGTFSPVNSTS